MGSRGLLFLFVILLNQDFWLKRRSSLSFKVCVFGLDWSFGGQAHRVNEMNTVVLDRIPQPSTSSLARCCCNKYLDLMCSAYSCPGLLPVPDTLDRDSKVCAALFLCFDHGFGSSHDNKFQGL